MSRFINNIATVDIYLLFCHSIKVGRTRPNRSLQLGIIMSMSSEDIDKLQADLEEGLRKTEEKISDINKIIFLEKFASRFFVTWSIHSEVLLS